MRTILRLSGLGLSLVALAAPPLLAQVVEERVDLGVIAKIREEGLERSHIPQLAHHLTDVIGPRLTGSPGMRRANEWTAQMFREWGLQNVAIEPWGEFGRGWENVSYTGRILTPYVTHLYGHPTAWTGSTKGAVRGRVMVVQVDSAPDVAAYRGKLKGAWVMMQEADEVGPDMEWRPRRAPAEDLLAPVEERGGGGPTPERIAQFRARAAARREARQVIENEGIAGILSRSPRKYGIINGGGNAAGRDAAGTDPLPDIVIGEEQYGQLYRNVMEGLPVEVEINVQNRFYKDDLQAYNTFGDIPGTDKAGEYVMIGAHLDSWHWGTGATDNGAGSVVMMEAMRILKTLNLEPRRTIRIGLWSGEEQGLLGSRNWLEKHPEIYPRISAYLNVDNGTGKIRGIWDQSNSPAGPIFEQILFPFRDLGVIAVRHGNTGGTDHLSFVRNGIPGFNFIQDPIEYGIRTHHTNVDVYDQLMLDDLKQAAVIVAATAYELAMRDGMMPRPEPAQP